MAAALAASAFAQSPLTTIFAGGTSLAASATVSFDPTVNAPLNVTQIDVNSGVSSVIGNVLGPSLSAPFAIPAAAPLGVQVFSQSVWLDATQNAFGILTSNGVTLTLGNI
ncbi:MAG: hypothetical protein FJ306_07820 [Planctomycetes bacterium]|nr:hypothetical protein [Planctomycetota bacterium]